jgi:hypothetical protein
VRAFTTRLQQSSAGGWSAFCAMDAYDQYLLKCVAAIGQAHVLHVPAALDVAAAAEGLKHMAQLAQHLEEFYDVYGGVVGYQQTVLRLMEDALAARREREEVSFLRDANISV